MIKIIETNTKLHCCFCIYFGDNKQPCYAPCGYMLKTLDNNQDCIIIRSSLII